MVTVVTITVTCTCYGIIVWSISAIVSTAITYGRSDVCSMTIIVRVVVVVVVVVVI